MIRRLLIANRGEIACRIARTAQGMGIAAIAVHSDPDAGAMHVRGADEAVRIGPADARDSYLNVDAVVGAALSAGADAVHPGYGFLSESPAFAARLEKEGITFVGPGLRAIEIAGSKAMAKRAAVEAGLPVIGGFEIGEDDDPGEIERRAAEVGFPVLVKASAGGGGRGIRRVDSAAELAGAVGEARREAAAGFDDASLLIEKAIVGPRHIELQVIADSAGRIAVVGDRDCSLQRRRQKVVEEAPAARLDAALRAALHEDAAKLAAKIGYVNAGTVEFLVDSGGQRYFLEMNARLQVEHPVSEMVHGADLVEMQIRVAAGEGLPEGFPGPARGHAIEVRVCAEMPELGFVPARGTYGLVSWPRAAGGPERIRVDAGVEAGDRASEHYDSLAAKLIVHHPHGRAACISAMRRAVADARIEGVRTNLAYVAELLALEEFARCGHATDLIAAEGERILESCRAAGEEARALAAACWASRRPGPAGIPGFRLNAPARSLVEVDDGSGPVRLEVRDGPGGRLRVFGEGEDALLDCESATERGGSLDARLAGGRRIDVPFEFAPSPPAGSAEPQGMSLRHRGTWRTFALRGALDSPAALAGTSSAADAGGVVSPMHGKIVDVRAAAGDAVGEGDVIALLEAMKMEIPVKAPAGGKIAEICCKAGDQVSMGDLLAVLDGTGED